MNYSFFLHGESPLRIRAANDSEVSRRTGWLGAECPDESGFARQILVGIPVFWRILPSRSHVHPRNLIVGGFPSVATDRCLLGSHQDRLVLKENKIRKTDLSECNERDQPIS